MPEHPYLQWPVFRRSIVAAFQRSLTGIEPHHRQASISFDCLASANVTGAGCTPIKIKRDADSADDADLKTGTRITQITRFSNPDEADHADGGVEAGRFCLSQVIASRR
jgi:hypothetical protein